MPFMHLSDKTVKAVREQSRQMEQIGNVTPRILKIMYDYNLFKLFVPRELGGEMLPLPDALRVFEQASWIDGSFGWLTDIGSGGGYFVSSILPSVCQETFSDKKAVVAGSGAPSGTAKRVDGGYLVSGRWKYCSGSPYATVFTVNCQIEGDARDSNPEVRSFILPPDRVKVIEDWNAFGLKATASHSIAVDDVFVPDERTFNVFDDCVYWHDPLYRYPFLQFSQTSFAAVCIGICRHFLDEAKLILTQNKGVWETSSPNRYPFVQRKVEEAERTLQQATENFYRAVDESWDTLVRRSDLSEQVQEQVSYECHATSRAALSCAQSVFPYLGISAIMEDAPVNRAYRNLHTACQHTMLVPFYEIEVKS